VTLNRATASHCATALAFSYDETTDVGRDSGSAVGADYEADGNEFPGVIDWVQIETGKADNRHLYRPRTAGGSPWPASDPGTRSGRTGGTRVSERILTGAAGLRDQHDLAVGVAGGQRTVRGGGFGQRVGRRDHNAQLPVLG
jgi:hypothetical protein